MPVTERLMKVGQWSLKLSPETPKAIRDLDKDFGHVYIFDAPVRKGLADATMLALSRWGGVVRRQPTPWDLGGGGMTSWLGDEDGKGPLLESSITGSPSSFSSFVTSILAQDASVTAGTVAGTVGGTSAAVYQWVTPRAAMDSICAIFGAEYRVNKDATLDYAAIGSPAMFKQTPTAVAMKRSSGRDLTLTGIPITQLDVSIDAEEYFIRTALKDSAGTWTALQGGELALRSVGIDTDGTLAGWTADVGAPTVAANVVTMPLNSVLRNGKTTWGSMTWDIRFNWVTGATPQFYLHWVDANNFITAQFTAGTTLTLYKNVAGVQTQQAQAVNVNLVNGTNYWFRFNASGTSYNCFCYADVSGAEGAQIGGTVGAVIADAAVQTGQIKILAAGAAMTWGGAFTNVCTVLTSTNYKDLKGNGLSMTKAITPTLTPNSSAAAQLRQSALAGGSLRNAITLATDEFDITRDVAVGDNLWVYDQDSNMFDLTNQVRYRGAVIFPIKVRVLAITWPIERGLAVWYRDQNAVWTDLSNFIVWEQPGATFEVGAASRALLTTP